MKSGFFVRVLTIGTFFPSLFPSGRFTKPEPELAVNSIFYFFYFGETVHSATSGYFWDGMKSGFFDRLLTIGTFFPS